jgi:hypothetical protein
MGNSIGGDDNRRLWNFVSFVRSLIIKKLIKLTTSEKRHMKEVPFLIAHEGWDLIDTPDWTWFFSSGSWLNVVEQFYDFIYAQIFPRGIFTCVSFVLTLAQKSWHPEINNIGFMSSKKCLLHYSFDSLIRTLASIKSGKNYLQKKQKKSLGRKAQLHTVVFHL